MQGGPVQNQEDLRNLVREAAKLGMSYHEAPRVHDSVLLKWFLTVSAAGLLSAVGGLWVMHADLAALQAEVTDLKAEVSDLKKLVEPQLRGST